MNLIELFEIVKQFNQGKVSGMKCGNASNFYLKFSKVTGCQQFRRRKRTPSGKLQLGDIR